MQVLIETRMNSLRLNESKAPRKGCLGRIEGVCADFKNPTRNGRLYPLELWKKVFDDELFKEALQNRTLFGELDHPEERFEPLVKYACIVMTDYTIDEDAGLIYGGFDILDTPDGRTLKSILDYGSVLGVSSRGQGDIIESAEGERVDEDSYDFACFDVVSTPAVEKARQKVVESMKREKKTAFKESIVKQIDDAETTADLNIIRSVVRSSDLTSSEIDSIIESIEDKCKSLQDDAEETILAAEENSDEVITDSEECVTTESAKTIRDNAKLYRCISGMREQVSAYKHREKRYIECINDKISEISERDSIISEKDKELRNLKSVVRDQNSTIRTLRTESAKKSKMKDRQVSSLKESVRSMRESDKESSEKARVLENKTSALQEQLKASKSRLTETAQKIDSLTAENTRLQNDLDSAKATNKKITNELSGKTSKLESIQEQLDSYKSQVSELQETLERSREEHSAEVSSIDNEVSEYSRLLSEAQDKISSGNNTIEALRESLKETQTSLKSEKETAKDLKENLTKYQKAYIDRVSSVSGIDPDSIYHTISDKTSPKQIDTMVESYRKKLDRYNRLGISEKGIDTDSKYVVESLNSSYDPYEAQEQDNLISFLKTTASSL